ncbi:MAG TPA: class I SAM-dependent methyltransferase [Thermomicrobiaceae bacterium]|nr:class I SAM-dependent methyltransferase [Thermomicrobiaceae bacterium]
MTDQEREQHEHFEQWAKTYDQSRYQRFIFQRVHQGVVDLIQENRWTTSVILDLGCGTGQLLGRLAGVFPAAELIGVDPAEAMIEVARTRRRPANRYRFEAGSAQAIPLPDTSVDLAVSTISAHHWPDLPAGAREIARVLRPGGHVLIADFAPNSLLARLAFRFSGDRMYGAEARRAAFEQAGLTLLFQQPLSAGPWWPVRLVLASAAAKPESPE